MTPSSASASASDDAPHAAHGASGATPSLAALRLDVLYAQACALLRRHLEDSGYGVPELVRELGVSRPTVYRAFARHGATVAGRLRELRLARVRELLVQPSVRAPIETLAYRCGFDDARTFSRCFVREFGVSAGAYRVRALQDVLTELATTD